MGTDFSFKREKWPDFYSINIQKYKGYYPIEWTVTIVNSKESVSKDHLWYFHGTLGTENSWYDGMSALENYKIHQLMGDKAPTVISLHISRCYLFDEDRIKYFEEIFKQINKIVGVCDRRIAMGISMGGLNVLRLLMNANGDNRDRFNKAIVIAPSLPLINPYLSAFKRLVRVFRKRPKNAKVLYILGALKMIRYFFDEDEWRRCNPLGISRHNHPGYHFNRTKTLVVVGEKDEFGFFPTANELFKFLYSGNQKCGLAIHDGGHVVGCHQQIADWITK